MTAVLAASDALVRDRHISIDDSQFNYSSSGTDWRAKYSEVAEMLAETRAELDDFHHASKELEAELENELQRTEKAQQELRIKVARTESERDDWKSKFLNLQTTHNTTVTSLQRELDKLRQEHQQFKVQLRELELGNDDLERNERAVSSSLADMEAKYSRALEEKILLEHELLEKAKLEEENQRLKDELRDANDEISILKDQVASPTSAVTNASQHMSVASFTQTTESSAENLLHTSPPPDLQLSELYLANNSDPFLESTPKAPSTSRDEQTTHRRSGLIASHSTSPGMSRSTTTSSMYGSIAAPKTPASRIATRSISTTSTTSTISTASKNKGVQMVSEMRARVKNLEQKLQTRVPRLRMGSITNRTNNKSTPTEAIPVRSPSSSSYTSSKVSTAKTSWESLIQRQSIDSKRCLDIEAEKSGKSLGDTSGWVLIMEDSPLRAKGEEKERRRTSSPSAPSAYRALSHNSSNLTESSLARSMMNSGIRRPSSRLSGSNLSTSTTSSVLPTPTSRPATPTFLPLPSTGSSSSTRLAGPGLRRSTGPGSPNPGTPKISMPPLSDFRSAIPSPTLPSSGTPSYVSSAKYSSEDEKALPKLPPPNFTTRLSKLPKTSSPNPLSQSRIGRPSGRKSAGDPDLIFKLQMEKRKRTGSNNASKNGFGL
ncbi:hypothetical protein AX15_007162 [Amanita polypyramis BW_CC]|nr:hypothetical protein AX15_007162 [Amanita polypyramis BW_CC]